MGPLLSEACPAFLRQWRKVKQVPVLLQAFTVSLSSQVGSPLYTAHIPRARFQSVYPSSDSRYDVDMGVPVLAAAEPHPVPFPPPPLPPLEDDPPALAWWMPGASLAQRIGVLVAVGVAVIIAIVAVIYVARK